MKKSPPKAGFLLSSPHMRPSQLTLIHSKTRKRLTLSYDEALKISGLNESKIRDSLRGKAVTTAGYYITKPIYDVPTVQDKAAAALQAPAAKPVEMCWLCEGLLPPN